MDCCTEVVRHWTCYIHNAGQKRRSWNNVVISAIKAVGCHQVRDILTKFNFKESDLSYDDFPMPSLISYESIPELIHLVEYVIPQIVGDWTTIILSHWVYTLDMCTVYGKISTMTLIAAEKHSTSCCQEEV